VSRTKTAHKVKAPNAVYQSFHTESDASTVWRQVLDNGWAVVLGSGSSSATSQPISQIASRGSHSSRRPLGPSQSLSAIDDRSAEPIVGASGKWYVVTSGLKVGVFPNWYVMQVAHITRHLLHPRIEASVYVENVKGSVHEAYSSRADAERAFREACEANEVSTIAADRPRSSPIVPNHSHTPPQGALSTPPVTPNIEEAKLRRLEDDSEWAQGMAALSISSAAPAYHSSWIPSNSRTPPKPAVPGRWDEERRFPAPQPLTQHRSLPSTAFASPENSVLLQRAYSDGYTNGTPRGSPTQHPRATVGSAPHLRSYIPRKQLMSRHDILSPLSTPGVSSLSIDYASPARTSADLSTRSSSSRQSTPRSAGTPPMVTAPHSPASNQARRPNGHADGIPMPFDIRNGTSMLNGTNRTPRNPKKAVPSPPLIDQMGLSDMQVPLRRSDLRPDHRSPLVEGTQVPTGAMS
jgi:hypothetical protein